MKNLFIAISGLTTFLFTSVAMAHVGHDHSHASSGFIHASLLVAGGIVAAIAVNKLLKIQSENKINKGE
ncbi:MAG: hypothetical protein COA90_01970 [Gammaproteobacteria bacterium]|nr:MAG: hypothetical protein COA90_01970 [Gammaproteobacteria bacterium]